MPTTDAALATGEPGGSVVPVSLRAMTQAVAQRLRAMPYGDTQGPEVTVFVGRIPQDAALPLMSDGSERVAPYVVLYPRPQHGDPAGSDLADRHVDALWAGQLTVASGDLDDAAETLDRVHAWLHRWSPDATGDLDGLDISGLRHPLGYLAVPVLPDEDVTPVRFWTTTEYLASLTR